MAPDSSSYDTQFKLLNVLSSLFPFFYRNKSIFCIESIDLVGKICILKMGCAAGYTDKAN